MKLVVNVNQLGLLTMLKGYPERVATSIVNTMTRLTIMIQRRVKEKLSGEVLHVRTGTLRRSINQRVVYAGHGLIEGIVGTNVEYAAAHEYGFDGTVTVRAHIRRITTSRKQEALQGPDGTAVKIARWVGRSGKNRFVKGYAEIPEHSRHMRIPERSFLRSTLKDFEPQIRSDLAMAAAKALKP